MIFGASSEDHMCMVAVVKFARCLCGEARLANARLTSQHREMRSVAATNPLPQVSHYFLLALAANEVDAMAVRELWGELRRLCRRASGRICVVVVGSGTGFDGHRQRLVEDLPLEFL